MATSFDPNTATTQNTDNTETQNNNDASADFENELSNAIVTAGFIIGGQLLTKLLEKDQDAPEA